MGEEYAEDTAYAPNQARGAIAKTKATIPNLLDEIEKSLQGTEMSATNLRDRLYPVLNRGEQKSLADSLERPDRDTTDHFVDRLESILYTAHRLSGVVRDTTSRLEL